MSLGSLPLELLLIITSHLPDADAQCLRSACRSFLRSLPPPTPNYNHTHPHISKVGTRWLRRDDQIVFQRRLLRDKADENRRVCPGCICITGFVVLRPMWKCKREDCRSGGEGCKCQGCTWRICCARCGYTIEYITVKWPKPMEAPPRGLPAGPVIVHVSAYEGYCF